MTSYTTSRRLQLLGASLLVVGAVPAAAQQHDHTRGGAHVTPIDASARLPERTREQIRAVEAAVRPLATIDAARSAGFEPAFGWIPSMGTHWVNMARMEDGFDLLQPDHLLFSPIDGVPRLVGAAYAFVGARDAAIPQGFAGTLDRWHDHDWLVPRDQTVHMLHVWFVDSPDGPFAGHNPWLPFWALGLAPPDAARMRDPATARRVRALASALASTVEPGSSDLLLRRFAGEAALEKVERRRDAIRQLVPELRRAQARGDTAAWDRLAERGALEWRAIRRAYLESAPTPRARAMVAQALDQIMGREDGGHH